ncbi:MAG: glutamate 5-kinase [Sphingobacteriaceae bacterium]|nr:glutamate 5-kinase [Cytophagaceae bacterium]
MKPILVLKFGTASITKSTGEPDEAILLEIARQVARLRDRYRVVIVSSGAVGAGRGFLPGYRGSLVERKAAAAIGNPVLLGLYAKFFSAYGIPIAQSLCERQHFANRSQFLQLKETYETLWAHGAIPIANENDVVSNLELKFSDNDELATLIAAGFGADTLLFATSAGGLLNAEGRIVPRVERIDETILGLADRSKSALGLGGMTSKLSFAKRATRLGIRVVIFGIHTPEGILKALDETTGTVFVPDVGGYSARQKWLGSGSLATGQVRIDAGAAKALQARRSLLAVGIQAVMGEFDRGEVIEILDESGESLAVAKARISSQDLTAQLRTPNVEVAHADDIVLL